MKIKAEIKIKLIQNILMSSSTCPPTHSKYHDETGSNALLIIL